MNFANKKIINDQDRVTSAVPRCEYKDYGLKNINCT